MCDSLNDCRNGRRWWQTVKCVLGKGSDQSYPPILNDLDQSYVSNSRDKATLFNNFFLSHCDIDLTNARLPNRNANPDVLLDNICASTNEVYELIQSLDVNKSMGHDGISARMLKSAGLAIVPSLTRLFNLCLSEGKFPASWKKADVIPLHKKDNKDVCNNYRPVSILPVVSKILEQIVFKNVYNFFHQHSLLTSHQSGFRPNDSTVNQLAYLYHIFCEALDQKKDIRIIFCDISKAFDRVWHVGIIYKLQGLGISGNLLELFKDCLDNRQQRVLIKGQHSVYGDVKAGVPQGGVLGPLLFLAYINDLVDHITCKIKLFADDTVLYTVVDDHEASADVLNYNSELVEAWANQWIVNFNPAKTKTMTVSFKSTTSTVLPNYPLLFRNIPLEEVQSHKHLGLEMTSNLKWTNHVASIIKGVSKLSDVMQKLKYKLNRRTLENIYFTFVRPKLEYASIIWDDCTEGNKLKLENVQLGFARVVTGAKRGTSHELLYNETSWPTLSSRRNNVKMKFMHGVVHGKAPDLSM